MSGGVLLDDEDTKEKRNNERKKIAWTGYFLGPKNRISTISISEGDHFTDLIFRVCTTWALVILSLWKSRMVYEL